MKQIDFMIPTLLLVGWGLVNANECGSITCQNNATCIQAPPSFEEHQLPDGSFLDIHSDDSTTHCACPVGWTGISCDVRYRSCDNSTHKCYHGGECVLGLIDSFDNDQMYCNCDMAEDEKGNGYVGKYCETKITMECEDDSASFCSNNGVCNQDYPQIGKACICDDGFEGEHCEYKKDTVPDCTLDCRNGGHCKLGTPPKSSTDYFNISAKAAEEFQYCECSDYNKFHGQFCEIAVEKCGDEQCFYGSKCVQSTVNGQTLHHCDCRYANTESASFAGRFCQYEATEYCDKGGENGINGHLFCVNGGQCQAGSDSYLGCVCPEGYRGFSCEYYIDEKEDDNPNLTPVDDELDTICSLECNGRGTCRDGIKEKPSDNVVGDAIHLNVDDALSNENFEHCVCQPGWTGLQCEHQAIECGGGLYHCFHGSRCYAPGDEMKCDCSTANSTVLGTSSFAGEQCEHPATEICVEDTEVHQYNPSKGLSFCVNYGTCKAKVKEGEPHPGCNCEEGKWTGPHCEIKIAQPEPVPAPTQPLVEERNTNDDSLSTIEVIAAVAGVIIIVVVLGFALRQCVKTNRSRRRRMDKNAINWEGTLHGYRDEPINEVNLSPRRLSNIDPPIDKCVTSASAASSSRDPFASNLVVPPTAVPPLNASVESDNGPLVYLGPPQDEDGHVLHSVEIL